jgi:hypothetical protein
MIKLLTDPLFLTFVPGAVIACVAIIGQFWYKAHRESLETDLKHEMLQKGMSADDIVKVVQASKRRIDGSLPLDLPTTPRVVPRDERQTFARAEDGLG